MAAHRGLSCLLMLLWLLPTTPAQDAGQLSTQSQATDLVSGWLFAANDRIYRLSPDGSTTEEKYLRGLRQFGVIPGTQMAVAGAADGIWALQDGEWVEAFRGPWDAFEFSMNYRMMTVCRAKTNANTGVMGYTAHESDEVFVVRLQPKVEDVEGFGGVPPLQTLRVDGQAYLLHPPGGLWMGGPSGRLVSLYGWTQQEAKRTGHPTWLPSGQGELAFGSNQVWLRPDLAPGNVWVTADGEKAPVTFIAADDGRDVLYATCAIQGNGYLLKLDVAARAKSASAVPGQATWDVVFPLTPDIILRELETQDKWDGQAWHKTAVDVVAIAAPAPYLAYVVATGIASEQEAGLLEWVNLETGQAGRSRRPIPTVPWQLVDLPSGRMLAIARSQALNQTAQAGTFKGCVLEGERLTPVLPDVTSLAGFGPLRWAAEKKVASSPVRPAAQDTAPGDEQPEAKLERFPMEPTGQEPPVALVSIRMGATPQGPPVGYAVSNMDPAGPTMKTYLVMPDGSLQEHRGYFRFDQTYQLSGDHKVLVVNRRPAYPNQPTLGPCHVFTQDALLVDPAPGVLSADGARLWVHDRTPGAGESISSWDVATGDLELELPIQPGRMLWGALEGQELAVSGPEFAGVIGQMMADGSVQFSGWLMADEPSGSWVSILPETAPLLPMAAPRGPRYSCLWRTPAGALIVGDRAMGRTWFVCPDRAAGWTAGASRPVGAAIAVASGEAVPDEGLDHAIQGVLQHRSPERDRLSSAQPEWNRDGTMCLWSNPGFVYWPQGGWCPSRGAWLIDAAGEARELPKEIVSPHFTADGQHLLAVVDAQMVDRNSPPGRQVVAKIDIAAWQTVWSSQPFANCEGMYPYPDFDLKAFHDPRGAGL